jgi:hypothetical protein
MTCHVASAWRLSSDPRVACRLLDLTVIAPTPAWGRDELKVGRDVELKTP